MVTAKMKPVLLYIASDVRSGSTLLDILMGQQSGIVSLGELHHIHDFVNNSYKRPALCSCGYPLDECLFWGKVLEILDNRGVQVRKVRSKTFMPSSHLSIFLKNVRLFTRSNFNVGRDDRRDDEAVTLAESVFDAAAQVADAKVVVDSSKWAERGHVLYRRLKNRFKLVYLVRDGRGVTLSKMNRDSLNILRAALSWNMVNAKHLLLFMSVPASQRLLVRYEDLCADPVNTVQTICKWLDVRAVSTHVDTGQRLVFHNIGGSPSRFAVNNGIRLDDRWKRDLTPSQKGIAYCMTYALNRVVASRVFDME